MNFRLVLFNHGNLNFHISNGDQIAQLLLERIALPSPVVAVKSLPETIRGAQCFSYSGLNALREYADTSSAATADLSAESLNILDHIEGTVDPNLIVITHIQSVHPNTSVAEYWEAPTTAEAASSAVPPVPPEVTLGVPQANHIQWIGLHKPITSWMILQYFSRHHLVGH